MSTWSRAVNLYIDSGSPGGASCLLDGLTSALRTDDPSFIQGDVLPLRLWFRTRGVTGENSTGVDLDSGSGLILAAKASSAIASGSTLLQVSEFVSSGSAGSVYYEGTLRLDTTELATAIGSADSLAVTVDVEVQAPDTANPVTFRFTATVYRQVYVGGAAPSSVGGIVGRWEEYLNATGAKCLRVKNSDGVTLVAFAPAGETP